MTTTLTSPTATTATAATATTTCLSEDTRAAVLDAEGGEPQQCLVCYQPLEYLTLTPCQHDEICAICHLRLRHLHHTKRCPICKTENEQLIVDVHQQEQEQQESEEQSNAHTHHHHKTFQDYPVWGNDLGSDFLYQRHVGMFFPVAYFEQEIRPLFGYHCTFPHCNYTGLDDNNAKVLSNEDEPQQQARGNSSRSSAAPDEQQQQQSSQQQQQPSPLRALQDHLRLQHRLALCNLCVDHQRDFVARLPRFTPSQLKRHLQHGDGPDSGFEGHPVCEFCRPTRFYDLTQLHQHLQKEHYKCHVCEASGRLNQYFKNYNSLQRHFDKQHFLCHDVQCLTARFVVFANELDLRHHERQVHGGTSTSDSKIQLEFRVRGQRSSMQQQQQQQAPPDPSEFNYGLDGEAFVPAALPQAQQGIALHPLHVQRTAQLREQAAALRQTNDDDYSSLLTGGAEAFPSLEHQQVAGDGTAAAHQPLRMGWTEGTTLKRVGRTNVAGAVTQEDFPSLPQAASARPKHGRTGSATTTASHGGKLQSSSSSVLSRQMAAMSSSAGLWGSGSNSGVARVHAPPTSSSATAPSSFLAPSAAATTAAASIHAVSRNNKESNLTADNFPSLGPASQPHQQYTAANALAKKKSAAPKLTADNFPSLGSSAAVPSYSRQTDTGAKSKQQLTKKPPPPPSLNSAADFPAPPSSNKTTFRQQMIGGQAHRGPTDSALANVLQAPSPASSKATVEDMKATLGSARYKQLKKFTKEFAAGELEPDAYVDHTAALFDGGYGDPDFWNFIPSLLASCPDEAASNQATQYMENLRRMHNSTMTAESRTKAPATSASASSWSSTSPAPASRVTASAKSVTRPTVASSYPPHTSTAPGIKKKNAWGGGGGASTVVRAAKAPPGSVAVAAAANATPQAGSATSYMAKQSKQEKANQAGDDGKKGKKKKKQNDELRQLAFGK